ncbi:MAG TPA: hypothetical protein VH475_23490 [Tepidisphaeraceae bacterium]
MATTVDGLTGGASFNVAGEVCTAGTYSRRGPAPIFRFGRIRADP